MSTHKQALTEHELDHFKKIDHQIVKISKSIRVISALAWPAETSQVFFRAWRKKKLQLPKIVYPKFELSEQWQELKKIAHACDAQHPIGVYLQQTALSYCAAARMLESVGTPAFRTLSIALYGRPKDHLGKVTSLKLAKEFIKITDDFSEILMMDEGLAEHCIRPEALADDFMTRSESFFGKRHAVKVEIDPHLAAKAAAGGSKVRVRGATSYSQIEIEQLWQHEVLVHSLTLINGRKQPHFKTFGIGSPRTTATQEGLATFAELITATMDLPRLRRIALRIVAIQLALDGADFIEVLHFFIESGQSEAESFQSTARIFRGADLAGRNVFTKDVVYLKGLFAVHTFLRKSVESRKVDYPSRLFLGRLALGDVISLEPFLQEPYVHKAHYLPQWVANKQGLAAYLSYALLANRVRLKDIKIEDFEHHLDLSMV
ncbi:MAG: DUF1704 domain-containing protein [Oligoflexales bacterium]|nr:DUF1704 domain-containing protein [Oligoflexales bacterium]